MPVAAVTAGILLFYAIKRYWLDLTWRSIWFTDEKTFNAATPVNPQNCVTVLIQLKQRKGKFQKGDFYEDWNISTAV